MPDRPRCPKCSGFDPTRIGYINATRKGGTKLMLALWECSFFECRHRWPAPAGAMRTEARVLRPGQARSLGRAVQVDVQKVVRPVSEEGLLRQVRGRAISFTSEE